MRETVGRAPSPADRRPRLRTGALAGPPAVGRQGVRVFNGGDVLVIASGRHQDSCFGAIGETAMTAERAIEITDRGLPSTFVTRKPDTASLDILRAVGMSLRSARPA